MLLSFIIPAYNVEKFLLGTLQSVVSNNSFPEEYEIIIVDDGSQDSTKKVAQKFIGDVHGCDIKYHYQSNSGVSAARNAGLRLANGEYVLFLDADDILEGDVIKSLRDVVSTNADCYLIKQIRVGTNGIPLTPYFNELYYWHNDVKAHSGKLLLDQMILNDFPFRYVIKKSLLSSHSLYFDTGVTIYEDLAYAYKVFSVAKIVATIENVQYIYIINDSSATHTVQKPKQMAQNLHRLLRACVNDDNSTATSLKLTYVNYTLGAQIPPITKRKLLKEIKGIKIPFRSFYRYSLIKSRYGKYKDLVKQALIYCIFLIKPFYHRVALLKSSGQ